VKKKHQLTKPLKWHGGKHFLADWIISLMPKKHDLYLEPFVGSGAVLFRKSPVGVAEVINDLNADISNFFRVLRVPSLFVTFRRTLEYIPFGRRAWEHAREQLKSQTDADPVRRAVWFFICNRLSHAGRMAAFTGVTTSRVRCGFQADVAAYLGVVDGLGEVHHRLKRVLIENRPAIELIPKYDRRGAVIYCDPPYVPCTRKSVGVYGEFEMDDVAHGEFLDAITAVTNAKVLVSGYESRMYTRRLKGWTRHERDIANHAAGGKQKERKTELVWTNY